MKRVLVAQLDGKLPNLALMRIAAHHKAGGDDVQLSLGAQFERGLWDAFDLVYASAIFQKTQPLAKRLLSVYPTAVVGGTGYDLRVTVEQHGIRTRELDYSLYPNFRQSLGFTQRGCRLQCEFCVVPITEGKVRENLTIAEIWRGDPWPRELLLLDNDFFGQPTWRGRIHEIVEGKFKVSFNQGINCRCLTEAAAEAIALAALPCRDNDVHACAEEGREGVVALQGVWMRGKWRRVYIQLDGTVALPQSCNCVFCCEGGMVFDPLECAIDDHRVQFMQAEDPLRLRAKRFPEIDWSGSSDWTNRVQVVDGLTQDQAVRSNAVIARESAAVA